MRALTRQSAPRSCMQLSLIPFLLKMAQKSLHHCVMKHHPQCTVSIIGSAGRRSDATKMNKELFYRMVDKAEEIITSRFNLEIGRVHLVSGGAAWADHIAVILYMHGKVPSLTLHFPAEWHKTKAQFEENDKKDIQKNPGRSANKLHRQFSDKIGENSLQQIQTTFTLLGAKKMVHNGFLKRNSEVAKSDYLIAFTWGDGDTPKKGGTYDTWNKSEGRKVHIPLKTLVGQSSTFVSKSLPTEQEWSPLPEQESTLVSEQELPQPKSSEPKLSEPSESNDSCYGSLEAESMPEEDYTATDSTYSCASECQSSQSVVDVHASSHSNSNATGSASYSPETVSHSCSIPSTTILQTNSDKNILVAPTRKTTPGDSSLLECEGNLVQPLQSSDRKRRRQSSGESSTLVSSDCSDSDIECDRPIATSSMDIKSISTTSSKDIKPINSSKKVKICTKPKKKLSYFVHQIDL